MSEKMSAEELERAICRLQAGDSIESVAHNAALKIRAHIAALQAEADALRDALAKAEARIGQCPWLPIETLGFGVEQHIVIATEYGFAWVVECDKDMDGEWLKRSYAKDAEHTGPVTHWRLLDLPQPALLKATPEQGADYGHCCQPARGSNPHCGRCALACGACARITPCARERTGAGFLL